MLSSKLPICLQSYDISIHRSIWSIFSLPQTSLHRDPHTVPTSTSDLMGRHGDGSARALDALTLHLHSTLTVLPSRYMSPS
jgi:hypothetical protein